MAAVVKGRGVQFSCGGVTYTAGIVSATNADFPQKIDVSRTSEKAEVKDTGGTIRAVVFSAFKKMASITVVPCSLSGTNTIANAETSIDAHTLQAGTAITVVDANGTVLDATYNLISAKQGRTVNGVTTVDLELETSDEGIDITTVVS